MRQAIPFPADGQLYGWVDPYEEVITALISVYNPYDGPGEEGQDGDQPAISVMPLAGLPAGRWPQAASEEQFGPWFWTEYRAGRIILLDKAIPHFPILLWSDCAPRRQLHPRAHQFRDRPWCRDTRRDLCPREGPAGGNRADAGRPGRPSLD